jgi:hypothetical protein
MEKVILQQGFATFAVEFCFTVCINDVTIQWCVICVCYEFHFLLQEWDQLLEQQREIEDKLQELEASPPRFMII